MRRAGDLQGKRIALWRAAIARTRQHAGTSGAGRSESCHPRTWERTRLGCIGHATPTVADTLLILDGPLCLLRALRVFVVNLTPNTFHDHGLSVPNLIPKMHKAKWATGPLRSEDAASSCLLRVVGAFVVNPCQSRRAPLYDSRAKSDTLNAQSTKHKAQRKMRKLNDMLGKALWRDEILRTPRALRALRRWPGGRSDTTSHPDVGRSVGIECLHHARKLSKTCVRRSISGSSRLAPTMIPSRRLDHRLRTSTWRARLRSP
jgi:hypothetical protein